MENSKRTIPRHVDSRIMIFGLTLKRFFAMIPLVLFSAFLFITHSTPLTFVLLFAIIGILFALLVEFKNKETGYSWISGIIRHKIEGDRYYQRHCLHIDESKRNFKRRD